MRLFAHIAVFALFSCIFPVLAVQAQEASVEGLRSCGVPKDVTVPGAQGYCDIYQRQLLYREKAKVFRQSLEGRRIAYEKDHFDALEKYRVEMEAVYQKESEEYQNSLSVVEDDQSDKEKSKEDKTKDESKVDEKAKDDKKTTDNADPEASGDEGGVKEKDYPPEETDDGYVVKRRVIMPKDAPDFDEKPF